MMTILKTWLPLFIVRLVQRITRPVIMIFVSRNRPSGEDEFYSIKVSFLFFLHMGSLTDQARVLGGLQETHLGSFNLMVMSYRARREARPFWGDIETITLQILDRTVFIFTVVEHEQCFKEAWNPIFSCTRVHEASKCSRRIRLVIFFEATSIIMYPVLFQQLAILSICFTVPRVPYSWLNELKALEPTFTKV